MNGPKEAFWPQFYSRIQMKSLVIIYIYSSKKGCLNLQNKIHFHRKKNLVRIAAHWNSDYKKKCRLRFCG